MDSMNLADASRLLNDPEFVLLIKHRRYLRVDTPQSINLIISACLRKKKINLAFSLPATLWFSIMYTALLHMFTRLYSYCACVLFIYTQIQFLSLSRRGEQISWCEKYSSV